MFNSTLRAWVVVLALILGAAATASAQNLTSSSLSGLVADANGSALAGATVRATHVPTGTIYGAITQADGSFFLANLKVGGPYEIVISYVGFSNFEQRDVFLTLGQTFRISPKLVEEGVTVVEVVVAASSDQVARTTVINADRTGASTTVTGNQALDLPTITRNINDFTRLSPQSTGSGFAGQPGRFNNFSLDGAQLNNAFGLSNDAAPGADINGSPISLDAVDQVIVNIAPYDVRLSGFTGGGINAVTRSGTNEISGSVYHFWQNQGLIGTTVAGRPVNVGQFDYTQSGFRIGGPIIKNKLFFFVNAEVTQSSEPYITFRPRRAGETGGVPGIANVSADSLQMISDFLKSNFGYDPGATDYGFENDRTNVFGRIDWNLNENHKVKFSFSYLTGFDDREVSSSSSSNAGTPQNLLTGSGSSSFFNTNTRRNTSSSVPFQNGNYQYQTDLYVASLEVNSTFGSKISNQFIATVNIQRDDQVPTNDAPPFPMVEIVNRDPNVTNSYATIFGTELFRGDNAIEQDQIFIQNNLNLYLGKHNLLFGASFESWSIVNKFLPQRFGRYTFESFDAFMENVRRTQAGQAQSFYTSPLRYVRNFENPGRTSDSFVDAFQIALYAQDEFSVKPNLRVTLGLRVDIPTFTTTPTANEAATDIFGYNSDELPGTQFIFQPRLGVNWDVFNDKSLQVRGGTGIFYGRNPFVWFTNAVTNTGSNSSQFILDRSLSDANTWRNFDPSISAYNQFANPTTSASEINYVDPDFKFPTVWRTSVGADYELGEGFYLTFDGAYTKDVNAPQFTNLNRVAWSGLDSDTNSVIERPLYVGAPDEATIFAGSGARVNSSYTDVIVLQNTSKGYGYFFTLAVQKNITRDFTFTGAYTYTEAKQVTGSGGSRASSVFSANYVNGNPNDPDLSFAPNSIGGRFLLTGTYRLEWAKHFATTIGVIYDYSSPGRFSYIYDNDVNGDGYENDLMYVPRNASEISFRDITETVGGVTTVVASAADQWAALDAFITQDKYLNSKRGEFVEQNGVKAPAFGRLDIRILQDAFLMIGGKRHAVQFSVDIINFGNLLNDEWGVSKFQTVTQPLVYRGTNGSTGVAEFNYLTTSASTWRSVTFQNARATSFLPSISTNNAWRVQFGVRYTFN